jgi:carbamoyl-phosphate synthase small subunit
MKGILILQDGTEFTGILAGGALDWEKYRGFGEVVFNTGLSGYQEILTDPSYAGQMVVMTLPHIGNTGVNEWDNESPAFQASALIIHELTTQTSGPTLHWQSTESLPAALVRQKIPLFHGVDTRALTRKLRTTGVTRGILCPEKDRKAALEFLSTPSVPHADQVDWLAGLSKEARLFKPQAAGRLFRVTAIDYGIKGGLIRELQRRGCEVTLLPASSTAEAILANRSQGLFLSNGPGDPSKALHSIQVVRSLLGKLPIFGVCMGHQILGQALGARTFKLKFGHRGANQPVLCSEGGRVEISSHNHGYAVDAASLPKEVKVTHVHLNDQSVEGLRWIPGSGLAPAFSVQYHPEASPGPHDSTHLFDSFIEDMLQWGARTSA